MCGTRVDSQWKTEENPTMPRWMWMAKAEHRHRQIQIEIVNERKILETENGEENVELRRKSAYVTLEKIGTVMQTSLLTTGVMVICQARRGAEAVVGVVPPLGGKGMTGITAVTTIKWQNTQVGRCRRDWGFRMAYMVILCFLYRIPSLWIQLAIYLTHKGSLV
jgi:hypothetical protein